MKKILVGIVFNFLLCATLSAQSVQREILPCKYGARYLMAAEKLDSIHVIAGGGFGRVGTYDYRSMTWEWECLPVQFEITSILVTEVDVWAAGEGGNVWRRPKNANIWESINAPVSSSISGVQAHPDGIVVATTDGKILVLSSATNEWRVVQNKSDFVCGSLSMKGDVIAVPGQHGKSMFSRDAGKTWFDGPAPLDTMHITSALVVSDSVVLLCGALGRVFRSIDSAKTWDQVYHLIPPTPYPYADGVERDDTFRKLSMDSSGRIYVCGNLWKKESDNAYFQIVAKSVNGGAFWNKALLTDKLVDGNYQSLYPATPAIGVVMLNDTDGVVFCGSQFNGQNIAIHHTRNGGESWRFQDVQSAIGNFEIDSLGTFRSFKNEWRGAIKSDEGSFLVLNTRVVGQFDTPVSCSVLRLSNVAEVNCQEDTLATFETGYTVLNKQGNILFLSGSSNDNHYATSSDAGSSWQEQTVRIDNFKVEYVGTLIRTNSGLLAAATSSSDFSSSRWGFFAPLISTDNGTTWVLPKIDYKDSIIYRLIGIDKLENGKVLLRVSLLNKQRTQTNRIPDTLEVFELFDDGSVSILPRVPVVVRTFLPHTGYDLHLKNQIAYMLGTRGSTNLFDPVVNYFCSFNADSSAWSAERMKWSLNGKPVDPGSLLVQQVDRNEERTLMLYQYSLLFTSTDGCKNWNGSAVSNWSNPYRIQGFAVDGSDIYFFGTNRSLYKYTPTIFTSIKDEPTQNTEGANLFPSCTDRSFSIKAYTYAGELVHTGKGIASSDRIEALFPHNLTGLICYTLSTACGEVTGKVYLNR
ncbi:MAG: hypothetical protein HQ472_05140 [Ignavibacteria bacterium]|nr:hypothetical protein [Ignavibacteria bacterium]